MARRLHKDDVLLTEKVMFICGSMPGDMDAVHCFRQLAREARDDATKPGSAKLKARMRELSAKAAQAAEKRRRY